MVSKRVSAMIVVASSSSSWTTRYFRKFEESNRVVNLQEKPSSLYYQRLRQHHTDTCAYEFLQNFTAKDVYSVD